MNAKGMYHIEINCAITKHIDKFCVQENPLSLYVFWGKIRNGNRSITFKLTIVLKMYSLSLDFAVI